MKAFHFNIESLRNVQHKPSAGPCKCHKCQEVSEHVSQPTGRISTAGSDNSYVMERVFHKFDALAVGENAGETRELLGTMTQQVMVPTKSVRRGGVSAEAMRDQAKTRSVAARR